MAVKGNITVGILSCFLSYANQYTKPFNEISSVVTELQNAIACAARVFELIEEAPELPDKADATELENVKGSVEINNLYFSYNPDRELLKNVNINVEPGKTVAIVGPTGCGKTTLINLLMRFYDVDSGEILIDDVNIKDIDCATLRKNTAIVLQDTVLFADTIKNNLKYSNEAATDEQMYAAAAMSNCDTMINKMPLKYDTELMAEGENISQGQRQLLSIARAFLAQPKILILDEATSNVDTRTEKHIQDAMLKLMENRTSLIIAHRLSTIQDADIIVVMDEGHIVEAGNHKELLNKMGRYYKLYMTQFAGQTI